MKFCTIVLSVAVLGAIGCSSDAVDKDTKRSQDRLAMRLSESEMQRDQYKSQVEKLQAQLEDLRKSTGDSSQEVSLLRKQVQDLQTTNTQLNSQIEKLRIDLSRATASKPAQ